MQKLQIGPETKHKMLFEKITHRGPKAFQGLVEICRGNFAEAANLLQRKSSRLIPIPISNSNNDDDDDDDDGTISIRAKKREDEEKKDKRKNRDKLNDAQLSVGDARPPPSVDLTDKSVSRAANAERNVKLELFTQEVAPTKLAINVTKSKKYHTHKTLATYDMKSRHRGVFFLVNIINFHKKEPRNGASVDRDNLIALFRGMEFKIFYNEDITSVVSAFFLLLFIHCHLSVNPLPKGNCLAIFGFSRNSSKICVQSTHKTLKHEEETKKKT